MSALRADTGRGWTTEIGGTILVIALSGDWIGRANGVETDVVPRILNGGIHAITFESAQLGRWDSALIAFLSSLRDTAAKRGIAFDASGLPESARQLLALVVVAVPPPRSPKPRLLERLGLWTMTLVAETREVVALVGTAILRGGAAMRGRTLMRRVDLLDHMRDAGLAALPIVTVVNVLVGGTRCGGAARCRLGGVPSRLET